MGYRSLYIALGSLALVVGLIGIFVPLLPTTPLLILAAFLYSKGSPRMHQWMLDNPFFGPPLRDWKERCAIALRYKILATFMIVGSGVLLFVKGFPYWVLAIVAVGFSWLLCFLWRLRS